jgi:hypothetical protein
MLLYGGWRCYRLLDSADCPDGYSGRCFVKVDTEDEGMTLRTVTVIVLMLGAVAWCRAQEPRHVEDWPEYVKTDTSFGLTARYLNVRNAFGQEITIDLWRKQGTKPLTLDSLVVLWDEYKSWCDSDSGWIKFQSLAKCRELGYTVEDCGWHIKIYRKADIEGFMHFIRRKAGE